MIASNVADDRSSVLQCYHLDVSSDAVGTDWDVNREVGSVRDLVERGLDFVLTNARERGEFASFDDVSISAVVDRDERDTGCPAENPFILTTAGIPILGNDLA